MSKPSEIAVLSVAGQDYKDWETVMVRAQRQSPMRTCRFTCSEGVPLAKNWAGLQIKPGDPCSVTLGGQLAMTGTVYLRQVYDDAHRHHIEIGFRSHSASNKLHRRQLHSTAGHAKKRRGRAAAQLRGRWRWAALSAFKAPYRSERFSED